MPETVRSSKTQNSLQDLREWFLPKDWDGHGGEFCGSESYRSIIIEDSKLLRHLLTQ